MAKTAATKKEESPEAIRKKLVLTGADIVAIGEEAELLVGGKNYNTALISQIEGIQAPYFRAISSLAFHRVLDETKVTGRIVRAVVDREYGRIDWNDPEINQDPDFLQKFVRQLGKQIHDAAAAEGDQSHTKLRTFINTIVEGFATSPEGIDQLRKRSVMCVPRLPVKTPARKPLPVCRTPTSTWWARPRSWKPTIGTVLPRTTCAP